MINITGQTVAHGITPLTEITDNFPTTATHAVIGKMGITHTSVLAVNIERTVSFDMNLNSPTTLITGPDRAIVIFQIKAMIDKTGIEGIKCITDSIVITCPTGITGKILTNGVS